MKIADTS